jgi:hypothetical protein
MFEIIISRIYFDNYLFGIEYYIYFKPDNLMTLLSLPDFMNV